MRDTVTWRDNVTHVTHPDNTDEERDMGGPHLSGAPCHASDVTLGVY